MEDFRCSVSNINVFLVCKNVKENVVHGKIVLLDYFIPKEMANNEWRMRKMNAVNLTCARAYIYTHTHNITTLSHEQYCLTECLMHNFPYAATESNIENVNEHL